MSTLLNSTPVDVTYLDGKTETVQISRLSIRQLYTFAKHLAATQGPELVMLCTGRDGAWIDTLAPAAYGALHRACIDANFPGATEVAKGDPRLASLLMPFIQDVQMVLVLGMSAMLGPSSSASSSAPAPSASAAETGSDASISPPSASSPSSPRGNA